MMVSKLFRLALGLPILSKVYGQAALADRPAHYTDDIPTEEKIALASIVEDDPNDVMTTLAKGDWESPEYPLLFRTALPIPPEKQPK
jgi:hypothetical protein